MENPTVNAFRYSSTNNATEISQLSSNALLGPLINPFINSAKPSSPPDSWNSFTTIPKQNTISTQKWNEVFAKVS